MPELDPDLVRIIALGLLAVLVVLLGAVLASLGRMRKAVEAQTAALAERDRYARVEPRPEAVGAAAVEAAPQRMEPAPQRAEAAEPVGTREPERVAQEPEPVAQQPEPVTQERETLAAEPEPAPVQSAPQEQRPEPVGAREPEPEPATASTAAAEPQAQPDEPQEQPFERDGRWWFRRGDELLVYNDATGQWEAAPTQTSPVAASPAATVATEHAPTPTQEQQGFWKCPSCGAVNGSTATSCRMCFTARP